LILPTGIGGGAIATCMTVPHNEIQFDDSQTWQDMQQQNPVLRHDDVSRIRHRKHTQIRIAEKS
jgi:hypothetical protein